jgi:HSP20 family protein
MFAVVRKPAQTVYPRYFSPWDPFRLVDELLAPETAAQPQSRRGAATAPRFDVRFDVKETKEGYLFKADLPGLREEDVEISLTGNRLTVSGKRETEAAQEGETQFMRERTSGAFSRAFTLPETADTDKITASMKDGVLTLVVPKRSESQPRRVPIAKA